MTSIIKVNNLQNQCGANTINKCGTAITVGASGDTVTLAAGASQSGFGQTYSAVSWDTTPKTTTVTGVAGVGYFVNTTAGAITANLPAGTAGDVIAFADYTRTFQTNNLTITPNGSEKVGGVAANFVASTEGQSVTLVYVDATEGWINTMDSTGQSGLVAAFITATGGTITCSGDYKIHTFTGPGTFTVSCAGNPLGSTSVDYMIVAGGGGGGAANGGGGGGGAGGWRASSGTSSGSYCAGPAPLTSPVSGLSVSVQGYPIVIGSGGAGGAGSPPSGGVASSGANSTALGLTSTGGGGGGSTNCLPARNGLPGGSGGGSSKGPGSSGGAGNSPPVNPAQGIVGGGATVVGNCGGGGGGAAGQGEIVTWTCVRGGNGGIGVTSTISNTPTQYAGGGGANSEVGGVGGTGGVHSTGATPSPSAGPSSPRTPGFGGGLGHNGSGCSPNTATAGGTNTGGGGGGIDAPAPYNAPNGGSGIVIIRYKFQ
jgi:hypothetical protein